MIPRYQRILFYCLMGGCLLMGGLLIRGYARNQEHIAAMRDQSPIAAPDDIPDEQVTVALANDADGAVSLDTISLPLPAEPSGRASALLNRILADDARPASNHPLPPGPAVTDVFLLPLPLTNPAGAAATPAEEQDSDPATAQQLAVVNFAKAFAAAHPSGIEVEDLTLRQIIATLQANFPQIDQVRFLIDGQPVETLAGHADLTRAYVIGEPTRSIHVLAADGRAY
jgi:hypothetical protein